MVVVPSKIGESGYIEAGTSIHVCVCTLLCCIISLLSDDQ
jgi:hypothetical protein